MTVQLIQKKIQERLNKLDSSDYGNIEPWAVVEAFNKAQLQWVRRQLEGINQTKTGAEGTTRRIDDLEFILTPSPLNMTDRGIYWDSSKPDDYMEWCRVSTSGYDRCCPPRPIIVYLGTEVNRDIDLSDDGRQPSFQWATAFATQLSNSIRIYTNDQFDLQDTVLTYYRYPRNIQIAGTPDIYQPGSPIAAADVESEAPEDVQEIMVEDAARIIAGDITEYFKEQNLNNQVQYNT